MTEMTPNIRVRLAASMTIIVSLLVFVGVEAFHRHYYSWYADMPALHLKLSEKQLYTLLNDNASTSSAVAKATAKLERPDRPYPTRQVLRPLTAENWHPVRLTCRQKNGVTWASSRMACCVGNFSRPVALTRQDTRRLIDAGFSSSFIDWLPASETVLPQYNTCAVVSSSSALLRHHYGADIDRHDAVFRPNTPPIKGYEKYVGSKTTVRVVNSKVNMKTAAEASGADSAEFLFMRDMPPDPLTADKWDKSMFHPLTRFVEVKKKYPHLNYYFLHPLFDWRFGGILPRSVTRFRPRAASSTGFFTAGVALALCHHISVYEVASGQRHVNDSLCHYYDKRPIGCSGFHPFQYERTVLRYLSYNYTDGDLEGTVYRMKGAGLMKSECSEGDDVRNGA